MPSIKETLASNLKRLLFEKGMSQKELAEQLHVTVQTVSGLINAKAGVSGKILTKLANILEVEETDLVAIQTCTEKVELRKDQWEKISQVVFEQKVPIPDDILDNISKLDQKNKDWLFDLIRSAILLEDESKHSILHQIRILTSDSSAGDKKNKAVK